MKSISKSPERDLLKLYNIAFDNSESNPEIREKLTERYDPNQLAIGRSLLQKTEELFWKTRTEREKKVAAYSTYTNMRDTLDSMFLLHRKLAKILFRNDKIVLDQLAANGEHTKVYSQWILSVNKFYTELSNAPVLLAKFSMYNVTEEDVRKALQLTGEVKKAYTNFMNLKGESQRIKQLKDASFAELNRWMSDFYAIARIAFNDQPQHMESFGIVVK